MDTSLPPAKKSLGQHWLTDAQSLEAICAAAELTPADTVLEVGPGLGTLTKYLTEQAGQVVAVEFDKPLAENLKQRVHTDNLEVIYGDILCFDLAQMPAGYKVVANIPYYLTSNLIRIFSESEHPPQLAALLVQKEVAERVAAKPGKLSILGVTAQFYWQTSLGRVVPSSLFTPPPKVDSQILILKRRNKPLFPVQSEVFFRIVKAGFSQKRKTLLNSLSGGLQMERAAVAEYLSQAGLDPALRAQKLSLDNWYALYKVLSPALSNT